jgi:hypothetical protein
MSGIPFNQDPQPEPWQEANAISESARDGRDKSGSYIPLHFPTRLKP